MLRRSRPLFFVTWDAIRPASMRLTWAPARASGHASWRNMGCIRSSQSNLTTTCAQQGIETSRGTSIVWRKGSAEATGLPDASADLVTMASSFHWADFDQACEEFHRILRPGGMFVALVESSADRGEPVAGGDRGRDRAPEAGCPARVVGTIRHDRTVDRNVEREAAIYDVLYLEGRHSVQQTPEQYWARGVRSTTCKCSWARNYLQSS